MEDFLQIALKVKEYVEENGRTLSISQGKMLKDHELAFEQYLDKKPA